MDERAPAAPEPDDRRRTARPGAAATRAKLLAATLTTLRERGIAGLSARTVAAAAGVNQALVFYHFGSVAGLVEQACRTGTEALVAGYRDRFAAVGSLGELLALGRELHAAERREGNVGVLAQALAGGQQDPALAAATRDALAVWTRELEPVLARVLARSPVAGLLDTGGLARAMAAAFVGLELWEGVDPAGAGSALDALAELAVLAEVADELGPVARRAVRARLALARRTRGRTAGRRHRPAAVLSGQAPSAPSRGDAPSPASRGDARAARLDGAGPDEEDR